MGQTEGDEKHHQAGPGERGVVARTERERPGEVARGERGAVLRVETTVVQHRAQDHDGDRRGGRGEHAAVSSPLVGLAGEETATPVGLVVIISIVIAALAFVTLTRKGAPPTPGSPRWDHQEGEGLPVLRGIEGEGHIAEHESGVGPRPEPARQREG